MFSHDILYLIALHIDDPKTYYNFALVCTKSARACRLVFDQIINCFVKKHKRYYIINNLSTTIKHEWGELPNGKKHGREEKYSAFGRINYLANWHCGKLHGQVIRYDSSLGFPIRITNYTDGKKHGVETWYFPHENNSSPIRHVTIWHNDVRKGVEQWFNKYGNICRIEIH